MSNIIYNVSYPDHGINKYGPTEQLLMTSFLVLQT